LPRNKAPKKTEHKWVEETLAKFESQNPGLLEQLSIMATQNQVRLSIYPQMPPGSASSSTEESTT